MLNFFQLYCRQLKYQYPCSYLDRIILFRDSDISFRDSRRSVPFRDSVYDHVHDFNNLTSSSSGPLPPNYKSSNVKSGQK